MDISVVIPTRDRHASLAKVLAALQCQRLPDATWEVVVVDDGSWPAVTVPDVVGDAACRVIRLAGVERSAARNTGAQAATGTFIVFVDDDMRFDHGFVAAHLRACRAWSGALVVGTQVVPSHELSRPFPRFRAAMEQSGVPTDPGVVSTPSFCTAANMSLARGAFLALGGFDESLVAAEDQDLALRHTARGGNILFLPDAHGVHDDGVTDIRQYCLRLERGGVGVARFCRRHPDWPENVARERLNGPMRLGTEPVGATAVKIAKYAVAYTPIRGWLFRLAAALERIAPRSRALDDVYRALVGVHIYRGYREGVARLELS